MAQAEAFWRRWLRLWAWGFFAYTVLGGLSATQNGVNMIRAGQPFDWPTLIASRLLDNYGYALFVPPLFLLVRRFPLDREHWARSTPILLAVTFAFVWIKCVWLEPLMGTIVPLVGGFDAHVFGEMYDMASIVVVAQAIEFYRRAQERERQALALREQLTHAQLDALRSQLHPHFLFNTLNSITSLIRNNRTREAEDIVAGLGELLRRSLDHRQEAMDTLERELEFLRRYFEIERIRFQDRLKVEYEIDPKCLRAEVPSLLLQPLAENAMKHGISRDPAARLLRISAARDGTRLVLTVYNDGPPLPKDDAALSRGIGMQNSHARLQMLYGDEARLRLRDTPPHGVRAEIILPFRTSPSP